MSTDPNNSTIPTSVPDSQNMYNYINNFLMNPSVIIILVVVVVIYIIVFFTLGKSKDGSTGTETNTDSGIFGDNNGANTGIGSGIFGDNSGNSGSGSGANDSSGSTKIIMVIVIGMLIVLLIFNGLQYFFGINLITSIQNLFSGEPQINVTIDQTQQANPEPIPEITSLNQVFNIPGNTYGYEDAKTLCSAYGARLASYNEIEDAYGKGAEWCNYGWSDNQLALFPTQKKTYNNLQQVKGHENDCGRPGINGGYIANPHVKFGVNCYGHKPDMTQEEEELMETNSPYPVTKKDLAMENRVAYWQTQIGNILVSPFNSETWSSGFSPF